ncbi:hypothetical protein L7F22_064818 [Adiantum nelumboides]|nr:hypothetical protein [Adiantum nelumboides]
MAGIGESEGQATRCALCCLGHDAMKRMAVSNVLVVGMRGLGVEIAKNICLAGVKSVTIYDPAPVEVGDLGTQFFLRPGDVGPKTSRAQATAPRLAELNTYVPVRVLEEKELSRDVLSRFQVVVATNLPLSKQLEINALRTARPLTGMIVSVDQDKEGIVTTLDETRHGLEDGDYVTFSEVQGMEELNGCEPKKVMVKGPYTFSIGDTTGLSPYKRGGIFTQVKMPKMIEFKSLTESIKAPTLLESDFAKLDRPPTLHAAWQGLSAFWEKNGRLPKPRNNDDANAVLELTREIFKQSGGGDGELSEKVVKELAYQATGDLSPMVAFIGGFVAQEALKACSGKFHPLVQHLYVDSLESLPTKIADVPEEDFAPTGSRYDGQVAVFGKRSRKRLQMSDSSLLGLAPLDVKCSRIGA